MVIRGVLASLMLLLAACASSGYERFYFPNEQVSAANLGSSKASGQPVEVRISKNPVSDFEKLSAQGYLAVGESLFIGPLEDDSGIRRQAAKNGATLVLMTVTFDREVTKYNKTFVNSEGTVYEPVLERKDGKLQEAKSRIYQQRAIYLVRSAESAS